MGDEPQSPAPPSGEQQASTAKPPNTAVDSKAMAGKQNIHPELLFERYRDQYGVGLSKYLKFFRDAVLLDNSWTYGHAVSTFYDLAEDVEGHGARHGQDARVLSLENFTTSLRRFARQSEMIGLEAQRNMIEPAGSADADDRFRWDAFKRIVGDRLHSAPRSDEDVVLVNWFLTEEVQMMCLQQEYALRRIYKKLAKVKSWEEFARNPVLKLPKNDFHKAIREIIPKEHGGPLKSDDFTNAIKHGNHENSSRPGQEKDSSSGDATFPEYLEATVRCALGNTQIVLPADETTELANQKRAFDPERDSVSFAAARINHVWQLLDDWFKLEMIREDAADDDLRMEDCPVYDLHVTDMQMLFVHYATGEEYSRRMDYTDPRVRMTAEDFFRFCRDASFMDDRITFTRISEEYCQIVGVDSWAGTSIDHWTWQRIIVSLARKRYPELKGLEAMAILISKWILPMVQVQVPRNELTNFLFSSRIITLFLTYEKHVQKILSRFCTSREITIGPDGEETAVEIEDPWPSEVEQMAKDKASRKSSLSSSGGGGTRRKSMQMMDKRQQLKMNMDLLGEDRKAPTKTEKVMTLIDFVSFLKCLNFLPDLIHVEEVPEIFETVINAVPSHQKSINEGGMSVSQVMISLVHIALIAFARPPYASKYATREGKVLTTMERVEVAYHGLFREFMPLKPRADFPSARLKLEDLTEEGQLRDFLLNRRLERGMPLVALGGEAADSDDEDEAVKAVKLGDRLFVPLPEKDDGNRPASLGIPCLIREQLFAPDAPHPVGPLMETALIHHNAARHKAAVETYLLALSTWASIMVENSKNLGAEAPAQDQAEGDKKQDVKSDGSVIDEALYLYFYVALGGVYESANLEELALACYSEAKIVGDKLEGQAEQALAYSAIGSILFHLGQHAVSLHFFRRSLSIRESTLGEVHMDTGLLYNNIGACYDMLNRVTESIESFSRAKDVFQYGYGLSHPRTSTTLRNLSRVRTRRFDFHVSFADRKPTPCPPILVADDKKKKKKGKKGGGKGKKKK